MHSHIVNGRFQSDKYPTCPVGKVPLSTSDPMAQDLLLEYAQRRRNIDAIFSHDLETCLIADGFSPAQDKKQGNDETEGDPIGWKIIATGDDGSVLCESPTGNRRRYWFVKVKATG